MAKTINFEFKNETYILEFDRKTASWTEDAGFMIDELTKKPNSMIPLLFYGAFKKNNPGTKRKVVDEIYGKLKDKSGFLEALVELYNEPLEALFEEQDEGNVEWGKNW